MARRDPHTGRRRRGNPARSAVCAAAIGLCLALVGGRSADAEVVLTSKGPPFCKVLQIGTASGPEVTRIFQNGGVCSIIGKDRFAMRGRIIFDQSGQLHRKSTCAVRPYCFSDADETNTFADRFGKAFADSDFSERLDITLRDFREYCTKDCTFELYRC